MLSLVREIIGIRRKRGVNSLFGSLIFEMTAEKSEPFANCCSFSPLPGVTWPPSVIQSHKNKAESLIYGTFLSLNPFIGYENLVLLHTLNRINKTSPVCCARSAVLSKKVEHPVLLGLSAFSQASGIDAWCIIEEP